MDVVFPFLLCCCSYIHCESCKLCHLRASTEDLLLKLSLSQMARVRDLEWPSRIPEEDWKEIEQEIPSKEEPFIKKYLDGQAALISQEKKQRSGT